MAEATADITLERDDGRSIDLTTVSWWKASAVVLTLVSFALRMFHLGNVPLSTSEGNRAFQALAFFDGRALAPGEHVSRLEPAILLGQAGSLFLFGESDSVVRFIAALAGAGIVLLILALSPFVGRAQAMAMAILATFSPTLLYASRLAEPPVLIAFFAMLVLVSLLYHGRNPSGWWAAGVGLGLGGMFASGPASISVLLCMGAGFAAAWLVDSTGEGAAREAIRGLRAGMNNLLILGLTFLGTLLVFFTHGLSSLSSLRGIPETISSWGRLIVTSESSIPTQYFLLVILLYEILALVCALIGFAVEGKEGPGRLSSLFFLGWFVASLVLFSFSSGRSASQAVLVVLPLVLWGGYGAGALLEAVDWKAISGRKAALLVATLFGLILAVLALIAALGRIGSSADSTRATIEALMVAVIAVAPLTYLTFIQLPRPVDDEAPSRRAWRTPLLALGAAVILLLALYTLRSTVMLNYYRADGSSELLAQRTSTPAVSVFASRITNVSRDLAVSGGSPEDPEGGHSIAIEIEQGVKSPFRWYFRDFPNVTIVAIGQAGQTGADLVIVQDQASIDQANYTPQILPYRNRVPPQYVTPSIGNVLKGIFLPSHWENGVQFLLFRDGITLPDPESAVAGYGPRISNQLAPSSGPYSLSDRPGPGAGRGQFDEPRGIAADITSGNTYVVDMGNDRVESFSADGAFAGSWGGMDGSVSFGSTEDGLGPTGIAVGFDGLIYVADTWNHRVVVLNSNGDAVREFGAFGDTADSPDASLEPGLFFGPRDVAVTGDEIYVVDTGNERVQVFAPDGTFVRSWGGKGNGPTQFVEPVGIVIGPDGRVYVADSGNGRISVFQRDGTAIAQWPVDAWQGQAYFEPYLAFDNNGLLYATSSATGTVEVYDIDGNYVTSLTGTGLEQFQRPIGVTQGANGQIMVTDAGLNAVLEFAPIAPPVFEEPIASPVASPVASPQASPVVDGTPEILSPTPTAVG